MTGEDGMFRYIGLGSLAAAFVYSFLLLRKRGIGMGEIRGALLRRPSGSRWFLDLRSLSYYCTGVLFIILFATGMVPAVVLGVRMADLLLVVHVEAAFLFCISFTVALLLWAHRHRFTETDMSLRPGTAILRLKLLFWLMTLLTMTAMLSILLMLFPIFGSVGMERLADIHRYSVLLLSLTVLAYGYLLILRNRHNPEQ
jgi:hypothetical protein